MGCPASALRRFSVPLSRTGRKRPDNPIFPLAHALATFDQVAERRVCHMADTMDEVTTRLLLTASHEINERFPHTWEEARTLLAEKINLHVGTSRAPDEDA
jgi:hypothetical protein